MLHIFRVYVSTDSVEIAQVAEKFNGTVFMRDPKYAQDHVSSMGGSDSGGSDETPR